MKSILVYVSLFTAQLMLGDAAIADQESVAQSASEFQVSRFKAMVDADIEALEEFLADELTYAHTTGWTETKSEFLSTVETGKINYMAIAPADITVRMYDDVAVMTGLADIKGTVDDRQLSFTIRFLDVSRRVGDTWQLVAWQSVRMPDRED